MVLHYSSWCSKRIRIRYFSLGMDNIKKLFMNEMGACGVSQFAFFDFCAGNRHQILACARVEAANVTPKLWIARLEIVKVAQLIGI